ncbi:hypothetical protein MHYP_G00320230 [Metynnis hypsauchen]
MKVVSVTRKPDTGDVVRKKAPPPPKRDPSTSLTLRSKSMTAELEEMASRRRRGEKLDEMLSSPKEPVVVMRQRPSEVDSRAATVKQRPTSRRITQAEISNLFERQGFPVPAGVSLAVDKSHMQLPRGMSRTKSFGAPEDERISALIGEHRFPRSSSMTDSFRQDSIPPPPQTAPPPPPTPYFLDSGPPPSFLPPPPPTRTANQTRSSFRPGAEPKLHGPVTTDRQRKARSMIILQDTAHLPVEPAPIPRPATPTSGAAPPERGRRRGQPVENPYANVGRLSAVYTPAKPQRRKSPLVKQGQVEEGAQTARDPSPLGGARIPHSSRAEQFQQQVLSERARITPPGARRRPSVFLSVEGGATEPQTTPLLSQSHSVDELAELPPPAPMLSPGPPPGGSTFIHPLTGRPLDPSSPLALALAARERALSGRTTPTPTPTPSPSPTQGRAVERPETEGGVTPPAALEASPSDTWREEPVSITTDTASQVTSGSPGSGRSLEETLVPPTVQIVQPVLMDTEHSQPAVPPSMPSPAPTLSNLAGRSMTMSSEEEAEPYTVTLPPALLSSSDEETREELRKIGIVPPPQPFANGLLIKETPKATLSISPGASRPSIAKTSSGKASDSTADSGVEDPHMETTSTVSTVSSMSTLSSESTDSAHASKPRCGVGRGRPAHLRDPLLKQSSDSELLPHPPSIGPARPRYLFQRRSKLWGEEPRAQGRSHQWEHHSTLAGDHPWAAPDVRRMEKRVNRRFLALLFSSLGELHTISQRNYGTTFTIRPGSRYPVTRRTPSPGATPERSEPLGPVRTFGPHHHHHHHTILKSSSLSLPQEPKEVRFVMRSASARARSRSPSPSPCASPCPSPVLGAPLLALRPFRQRPLALWSKYDVGEWLESVGLGEHRARFLEHEIEGAHLPALTKDDLAELGVTRVGHRMNIERALKQLLESSGA